MPGLVGIVSPMPEQEATATLAEMVEALRHETFYVGGTWSDPSLGLYVGWMERPESEVHRWPLSDGRGEARVFFSGQNLAAGGVDHLAEQAAADPGFLSGLDGIFHGLMIDRRRGTATLFNDRYGLHRLYYHETKEAFFFAAEAKAILAVSPPTRSLDLRGLGEFVSCGCVLENRALFQQVHVLPPASAWVFRNRRLASRDTYFDPRVWENQQPLDPESYYEVMREAVSGTIPRYCRGSGPVAVALTGGLDTRVIMAWSRAAPGTLPCYTFGGTRRASQDVRIARQVSQVCGQPHSVLRVGEDFLARFPSYAERTVHLGEACIGVANAPDLYVSERARQIAPVKVVGTWGSEILRRTVTFKPSPPVEGLFVSELHEFIKAAWITYDAIRRAHPVTFAAFRQAGWSQYGVQFLEQTQLGLRAPFLANRFVEAAYLAPDPRHADVRARLVAEGLPELARIPTDRGVRPAGPSWATTAGRLYQEFTFKAEYAFDMGMPQWLARASSFLAPLRLDRLFLGRHKFLHFRTWYRNELSGYVKEMLLDPRTLSRPWWRRSRVEEIVWGHVSGHRNHTNTLHLLLTLELLHRRHTDS